MAVYAIGDVQGCAAALEALLAHINFSRERDRLWLTGDLVNRGAHSLEVLRLIEGLGEAAVTVLGNHDLHLLAVAAGVKEARRGDTLQPILRAPDRERLLEWLRHRPLMHRDRALKTMMVHAGIYPGWHAAEAARRAEEVENLLRGAEQRDFLTHMYGRTPTHWKPRGGRWQRARFITNAFTRMRYCDARGHLDFTHKGPPERPPGSRPGIQPHGLLPWFDHPRLRCKRWRIVFGHWSALGFTRAARCGRILSLDSGCVWGGALTAVRLDGDEAGRDWQVPCDKVTPRMTI